MKRLYILLAFLFVGIVGYLGMRCGVDNSCAFSRFLNPLSFDLLKPLWVYVLFASPIPVLLLFVRPETLRAWSKFAYIFIPISVLFIFITPTWSNSWSPLYSFLKEDAARATSVLFTFISLAIIVWKQFNVGKKLV